MIKLENLSRYYKMDNQVIKAVDNINLEIKRGEFVAISDHRDRENQPCCILSVSLTHPLTAN